MSDKVDSTASLRDAESRRVKQPIGDTIPAVCQPAEDGCEVTSVIAGKQAGDVLDDNPSRANASDNS